MEADLTKKKQTFLRQHILEKGYDTGDFIEYISQQRENGEDIENWSMASLEDIVETYTAQAPPPQNPADGSAPQNEDSFDDESPTNDGRQFGDGLLREIEDSEAAQKTRMTQMFINQSDQENAALQDFFCISLPTRKTNKNELNFERRLKIKVLDPEIIDKGLFTKKYAVYKVTTHPFKYEVKRRYNDFLWLRNSLIRDYPTVFVPPMAEKNQRNLEMDYLSRRAQILQQFMDSVGESEELRSSLHLLCFLKCTDENQWAKIKEEFDKSLKKIANLRSTFSRRLFEGKNPLKVEDFDTLKGELTCKIAPEIKEYSQDLEDLMKLSEPIYDKLIEQTRSLLIEFHNTCQSLSKVAETTAELHELHRKFNESVKTHKWESMQQVYSALNHTIDSWEKNLRKQINFLQTYFFRTFSYTIKEFEPFSEILKLRTTAGQEYFRSWVDLENRKEKLLQSNDVSKWEVDFKEIQLSPEDLQKNKKVAKMVMLPSATANLKQMQKVFGYLNVQLLEQAKFLSVKRAKRYVRSLTELCNEQIQHGTETTAAYSNLSNTLCGIFRQVCDEEEAINEPYLRAIQT